MHTALLLFALFLTLQMLASWYQLRYYRRTFSDAARSWSDGYLGVGHARSRFGRGAVALLEVGSDLRVRRLRTMFGATVFARFETLPEVEQYTLEQLAEVYEPRSTKSQSAKAVWQAIQQIQGVRSRAGQTSN